MKSVPLVLLLFFLLAGFSDLRGQATRHAWIFFRDKGIVNNRPDPAALGISEHALWRRAKVLPPDRLLDDRDLPVSPAYLDQLRSLGIPIRSTSRWLNAASVEVTAEKEISIHTLSFVQSSTPVAVVRRPSVEISSVVPTSPLRKGTESKLDYGPSGTQLNNINVIDVHNLGINGTGIIVGMIDDGFNNHQTHAALRNIRILDEHDFIHNLPTTQRQPWESFSQGNHGEYTLSALGGFEERWLIGPAYGASFILAKTEMDSTEVPAEEDLYVQALEWMEQLGADVVSTSLGYIDWYPYDSLNGTTAITSKAARVAASKGVLLVTAMGNEGSSQLGTLIAPADADSIISAGATFSDGEIASFSSTGPTRDGRIKPEVVAQGVSVVSASGTSGYVAVSGTSLSTPLTAGVAALVLSAHPELTPMQVREALMQTAVRVSDPPRTSTWPNNFYGNGMVDALQAVLYHGPAFSNQPWVLKNGQSLTVYATISSLQPLVADSLFVYYQVSPGGIFQRALFSPVAGSFYAASIPLGSDTSYPRGYLSLRTSSGTVRTLPLNAPANVLVFNQFITGRVPGLSPDEFILYNNYPNPFNPGTTISFDAPKADQVDVLIFNLLGQRVRQLFKGVASAGRNSFSWDGTDESGRRVSSGIYFCQLRTSESTLTTKMVLLK